MIESSKAAVDEELDLLARLKCLKALLGTDSPEVRGWAPAVRQSAEATISAAISATNEHVSLRAAAQRQQKHEEEDASIAWCLAAQLLQQVQDENENCAYWVFSAIKRLSSTHPRRPVIEVLALAHSAMPLAVEQYSKSGAVQYGAERRERRGGLASAARHECDETPTLNCNDGLHIQARVHDVKP